MFPYLILFIYRFILWQLLQCPLPPHERNLNYHQAAVLWTHSAWPDIPSPSSLWSQAQPRTRPQPNPVMGSEVFTFWMGLSANSSEDQCLLYADKVLFIQTSVQSIRDTQKNVWGKWVGVSSGPVMTATQQLFCNPRGIQNPRDPKVQAHDCKTVESPEQTLCT